MNQKAIDEFKRLKKELSDKLKTNFKKITKELFEEYPDLKYITWQQYAPYFNDGDACEFNVYQPTFIFANEEGDEIDEDENYEVSRVFNEHGIDDEEISKHHAVEMWGNDTKKYPSLLKFSKLITNGETEDLFKEMFGENHTILIHRDGTIDTTEAEHD